jgi:general secretion pathway protein G
MYKLDMGEYPEELSDLTEDPGGDDENKWGGPYVENPADLKDAWGRPLEYRQQSEVKGEEYYDLWSNGKDGEEGTDDDIKNWTEG